MIKFYNFAFVHLKWIPQKNYNFTFTPGNKAKRKTTKIYNFSIILCLVNSKNPSEEKKSWNKAKKKFFLQKSFRVMWTNAKAKFNILILFLIPCTFKSKVKFYNYCFTFCTEYKYFKERKREKFLQFPSYFASHGLKKIKHYISIFFRVPFP